jgi:GLPGLI family protein
MAGCSTHLLDRKVAEGVIEYSLSFPDYDPDGIMAGMLPERTTVSFADDKQVAELSAGMGIFRTTMVVDGVDQGLDYHLSMMSKKMVAHLKPRDIGLFNQDTGTPTIIYTTDRDTIAGYPCKRAIAIFDGISQRETDLWYTDRINVQNPNWFGPFAEIPGVLLRYDLVQHGMRMRLEATSVKAGKVDQTKFNVKADFEEVQPEVLHHELAEVLGTFSM